MRQCKFPMAPTSLVRKNDNLDIKFENNQFGFRLNNLEMKGEIESSQPKYRIHLLHKVTGETIVFNQSEIVTFRPQIESLDRKESGSNMGASFAELTKEFGSTKAKKQLMEKEKLNINKEAQKMLRDAGRNILKDEKLAAAKGNKLDKTYMECTLDGSFSVASMSNLIDQDKKIKLSNICPKEIFDALQTEAETIIGLSISEIICLEDNLKFHNTIVDLLKTWNPFELRKIQLSLLLEYLIRFSRLDIKHVRLKFPLPGCSPVVTKFIILNFTKEVLTDGGKPQISIGKEEKDKILMMIIILYGYLSNYEFPTKNLLVDIKTSRERIKKLAQIVDIRIIASKGEYYGLSTNKYVIEDY